MDDRNRREPRNRMSRGQRDQYRDTGDYYSSRQAEQFDDSGAFEQDRSWSSDARAGQQMGEGRRRGGDFGGASGYAAREAGFGDDYYDNGLGYYGSDSTAVRPATRERSYDRSYARNRADRSRDTERGFFERASDEVASWFGDDEATRRRMADHRGKGPANYRRTDERILEDVCDRLTEDPSIDARNVQVTVNAGEITLDGTVDSRAAKRRAEDIVDDISGVGHVQNNLRVQDGAAGAAHIAPGN